jgi:hypothetical protein
MLSLSYAALAEIRPQFGGHFFNGSAIAALQGANISHDSPTVGFENLESVSMHGAAAI